MGLFSGIGKAFKKVVKVVEDDIIEPIAKDAIPLTAAYFTGGASTQFLPPSHITDKVLDIAGVDRSAPVEEVYGPSPVAARSAVPAQAPQLTSSTSVESRPAPAPSPPPPSASVQYAQAPQSVAAPMNYTPFLIAGGVGVGLLALVMVMGKGK